MIPMPKRSVPTALALVALAASCGPGVPDGSPRASAPAVWKIDDDANLAYPTCGKCGAIPDRGGDLCAGCGSSVHIAPETIACPECNRSRTCAH